MSFMDYLKEILGVRLAFAIAGVVTFLLTGSTPLAVATGVGAVVLVLRSMRAAAADKPLTNPSETRAQGGPFTWTIAVPPEISLMAARDRLCSAGLDVDRENDLQMELSGSSQLWMRIWGGYFVDPTRLPIQVALSRSSTGRGGGVVATVHDALGPIAVRDEALERRYGLRISQLRDALAGGTPPDSSGAHAAG